MAEKKLSFSGIISAEFEMFNTLPAAGDTWVVDFSQVTLINSIGVQRWITWVVKLPSTAKVVLENCPFVIASQASSVHGFITKNIEIRSFTAYFICPKCEAEALVKLENGKHYWQTGPEKGKVDLPKNVNCSKCMTPVEPDFFPERTLSFLKI